MILLDVTLEIQAPRQSVDAPVFLGSALHGLVERSLHQDGCVVEAVLGSGHDSWCRLLPPPYGPITSLLQFGVALFGPARRHWPLLANALRRRARYLSVGDWRTPIERISVDLIGGAVLDLARIHLENAGAGPATAWTPPSAVPPQGLHAVGLDLITPVRLSTQTRRRAGDAAPVPSLAAIVRSAHRWVALRSPEWLHSLPQGLDLAALASEAEEAVPLHDEKDIPLRRWPHHGLRTPLYGREGRMGWQGKFSAPLVRLLELGQWVGVGQGTAMGLGDYRLRLPGSEVR